MQTYKRPDRRSLKSFKLAQPVRISVFESEQSKRDLLGVSIRDISGIGAFLNSIQSVSKGNTLKLYLTLPINGLDALTADRLNINMVGEVVRTEDNGFAIRFSETYQIYL